MNPSDSKKQIVERFIKTIYPEMTELAMSANTEDSCLRDAIILIEGLRARVKELEKGLIFYIDHEDEGIEAERLLGCANCQFSEGGYEREYSCQLAEDKQNEWYVGDIAPCGICDYFEKKEP